MDEWLTHISVRRLWRLIDGIASFLVVLECTWCVDRNAEPRPSDECVNKPQPRQEQIKLLLL